VLNIKTRDIQICEKLKEIYPLLSQGNRDIISEARNLMEERRTLDVQIQLLDLNTGPLVSRIYEGIRIQKMLKISLASTTEEMGNAALSNIGMTVLPILNPPPQIAEEVINNSETPEILSIKENKEN